MKRLLYRVFHDLHALVGLGLLCLAVSPPLIAADYKYARINVPRSLATEAYGINARGAIVGRYVDSDGVPHGFLLRKGVYTSIDVPGAMETLAARGINARGDIVGGVGYVGAAGECYPPFDDSHGFLLRDGEFTPIAFPNSPSTDAFAINDDGVIVGRYTDRNGMTRGFKAAPID